MMKFDDIYKIKLNTMKLHDLMLIYGLFGFDSVADILKLINLQPNKNLFFMPFMELDHSSLIQILSFESRFMEALLKEVIESKSFDSEYPLFYKMQNQYKGRRRVATPLEIAFENN